MKTRTKIGKPVSTDRWDYDPTGSGEWVMYARYFRNADRKISLYNTTTHDLRPVASRRRVAVGSCAPRRSAATTPSGRRPRSGRGRLAGCNVFLYDIAGDTTTKLTNPNGRCQYGPAVNPAGTVFFARSGLGCGTHVVLREQVLSSSATNILSLTDRARRL